jgi:hypothetical protein
MGLFTNHRKEYSAAGTNGNLVSCLRVREFKSYYRQLKSRVLVTMELGSKCVGD